MKIACLIDSLNSGGAQRQLCMLAIGLKKCGCEVEIITYYHFDFFRPVINREEIPLKVIQSKNKLQRIINIRKAIRNSKPDIVISYLNTPNLLAELSGLPSRNFGLIVSERDTEHGGITFSCIRRFLFHLLADAVVTNSNSQAAVIKKTAPWLRSRLATIHNCVDLEKFHSDSKITTAPLDPTRILVLGRFEPQKNPFTLLLAIESIVKEHGKTNLVVDWYGNDFFINGEPTPKSSLFLKLKNEIERRSLTNHFRLHTPDEEVVKLYQSASVVCLPSLHEGCSNVICEAMACGKPILASSVGDNPWLIEEGVTGYLFSPESPGEIADTIMRFMALPRDTREEMGRSCRKRAESSFSPSDFIQKYQELFRQIKHT